jgi:D-alanyl-D-alanine carboxypeptidase/D-alanyl-D-alanine-endopeptidase (penicillin-binding protein 4)
MKIIISLLIPLLILAKQADKEQDLKEVALNETFLPLISKSDSANSIKSLKSDFEYLLSNSTMRSAKFTISVYSLDRDTMLFGFNSKESLTPASITKLFTTFNAMQNMGKDHQISTRVYIEDGDQKDNVIDGNLYIKGGGDALFSRSELDTLFKVINNFGIKKINGNVYIDASEFDEETSRFKYSGDDDIVQNVGEITAFNVSRRPFTKANAFIKKSLSKNKISLEGDISYCELPDYSNDNEARLLIEFQRPLKDLIRVTNKRSDNYIAEHIFKLNGAYNDFSENDWESSLEMLYRTTDSLGIPCSNCEFNDGSGLSRRNLINSEAIVKLFAYINQQDYRDDYFSSLSIAGEDGTLKSRMIGTHAEKNVKAKTGTLRNASGLAGIVKTLDGENLAFALIFNGRKYRYYKQLENEMASLLAGFFYFNHAN